MTGFSHIQTITMSFVGFPLSNIFLALFILPQPVAVHHPIFKIPNVVLTSIFQHSMTVRLVVWKVTKVPWLVWVLDVAFTIFMIETELTYIIRFHTFIDCIFGYKYSKAMLKPILHTASINTIHISDNTKILLLNQLFACKIWLIKSVRVDTEARFVLISQAGWWICVQVTLLEFMIW